MTQRGSRTSQAATATTAPASGSVVTNAENVTGDGVGMEFEEAVQEEMMDLKSRVGSVEGHLSTMQIQLDSIHKLLTEFVGKRSTDAVPEVKANLKTTADEAEDPRLGRFLEEKLGKKPMDAVLNTGGIPHPDPNPLHGFVYTEIPEKFDAAKHVESHGTGGFSFRHNAASKASSVSPQHKFSFRQNVQHREHADRNNYVQDTSFSLSIARPKLDFPQFHGDDPIAWTRQCEKYFDLASVPEVIWVSMATLHCQGRAEHWWASLRLATHKVSWTHFCNLVCNRFSAHSMYDVIEAFNIVSQQTTATLYIDKFEELISTMQRLHPSLPEAYYVQCFIAGLKDAIKHYLKPHRPQTLCHAYWIAKDLE
uniref:Retrotransposon gag domain-containing protein n=1 Tax=Arundo donax TaxID=35708 RepID=A0A0A9HRG5_ARUDO